MPTVAERYGLPYDPYYIKGYGRRCPLCGERWPTAKRAIRCWYLHPKEMGGGEALASISLATIASIMGISRGTMQRTWHWLMRTEGAPSRDRSSHGDTYAAVVQYIRKRRLIRRRPEKGWTVKLGKCLGVTPQRISDIRQQAIRCGDI